MITEKCSFILNKTDKLFPWNFYIIAKEFIKENSLILNMAGNFPSELLENKFPPSVLTAINGVSESLKPMLINKGARFFASLSEADDNSFTLITNRLAPFSVSEAKVKLKKSGHIISEELGFETFRSVFEALGLNAEDYGFDPKNNLENKKELLINEGFKVVTRNQAYKEVIYSKEEFLDYLNALRVFYPAIPFINGKADINDKVRITEQRFIYTAKKIK